MPSIRQSLVLVSLLVCVPACAQSAKIPGTEIPDTDENRQILNVLERYRTAFVRLEPATVLATAHPTYYDAAGTDDPSDDVVYEELGSMLRTRMAQLESVRFTVDYLDIHVQQDRAYVRVWIDASFRLKPMRDERTGIVDVDSKYARKQDYAQFELLRTGTSWLITRGL